MNETKLCNVVCLSNMYSGSKRVILLWCQIHSSEGGGSVVQALDSEGGAVAVDLNAVAEATLNHDGQIILTGEDGHGMQALYYNIHFIVYLQRYLLKLCFVYINPFSNKLSFLKENCRIVKVTFKHVLLFCVKITHNR